MAWLAGCAGPSAAREADRWIAQQGGLCEKLQQDAQTQRIVYALADDAGLGRPRVRVMDEDRLRAYCFPPDVVVVSRGLAQADESILAAAVAHELGHLIHDGYSRDQTHRLTGRLSQLELEAYCDDQAVLLLDRAGYDPSAMQALLERLLADPTLTGQARIDCQARLALLASGD